MPEANAPMRESLDERALLEAMRPFAQNFSNGTMRKDNSFSLCLKASFSKCYEFTEHAWDESNSETAFFWMPTLRGICEDLILLGFIRKLSRSDREALINAVRSGQVHERLKVQEEFFSISRPFQPCLDSYADEESIKEWESLARSVWQANGWPNMKKGLTPPVRQIAEKIGGNALPTLYDYLYRLTSGTVHFSVPGLLRTGWGDKPKMNFSTKNFSKYYCLFGRIYGTYMLCVYFELFGRYLRPDAETKNSVAKLRTALLQTLRWPEIITFEEMNLEPPKSHLLQILSMLEHADKTRRFIRT